LLIDTTGIAHPRGLSNPGQCHVNFAEGCHLYFRLAIISSCRNEEWHFVGIRVKTRVRIPHGSLIRKD
jgi:hypothetical protein